MTLGKHDFAIISSYLLIEIGGKSNFFSQKKKRKGKKIEEE